MPDKNDTAAGTGGEKQPSSAPELNQDVLAEHDRREVEQAFASKLEDADVVVDLSEESDQLAGDSADGQAGAVSEDKPDGVDASVAPARSNRLARLFGGYWQHKKWTVPLTLLVIVGAVLAVPASRYPVLATFMKKDVAVLVLDEATKQPVGSVVVELDGAKAMTDTKGRATIKARVGERPLSASKRYYERASSSVFVPIADKKDAVRLTIKATGRQVPLSVVNSLTGRPVENVLVKAAGTEIKTDKDGKATLVLPADKPKHPAELSVGKYNSLRTALTVTEAEVPQNKFQLTPSGKVYFLSRKSGRIDVVKTNLDGSERQTVVAGTGREEDNNTILLASRDWKYLAFLSRRDSDKPKLYLIDTSSDKMTVMDEGDATFQLVGWSDRNFVYRVTRNAVKDWQPKKQALKSYNAASAKINVLDENQAEGDQHNSKVQSLNNFYLVGSKVLYTTGWGQYIFYYDPAATLAGKTNSIRSVSAAGGDKRDIKTFAADKASVNQARLYAPGEIYFAGYDQDVKKAVFFEYEDGTVKPANVEENDFYNKGYPTYLESPSGKRVFWSEQRDGKDTFFIGNERAEEPKQVTVLDEHQVYGWYSDDYLLVSKKGSELFIMPVDGSKVTKVTDYHKPNTSFRGYGGGYGGL